MLDSLSYDYNIDSTRVYDTGMSNGGFMSFLLSCQLSEKIAAIASVAGSMTPETFNNSNPQHPTPILQIHGPDLPLEVQAQIMISTLPLRYGSSFPNMILMD